MSKSPNIKTLKNKCDKAWADAVKKRANYCCEYCSRSEETNKLNAHHIYGRVNKATRWDLDNGICLCASHHTMNSGFSAHRTPAEFMDWIIDKKGYPWYAEMREKTQQVFKVNKGNLEEKYIQLNEILACN